MATATNFKQDSVDLGTGIKSIKIEPVMDSYILVIECEKGKIVFGKSESHQLSEKLQLLLK